MRVDAEGAAAVGDDLAVGGELVEAPFELVERDRLGAVDVPGVELLLGPDVDEHDVAPAQAGDQLVAADCLDVVAEVVARGALDLGQPGGGHLAQREPEGQDVVAGQRVADPESLAPANHQPRRMKGL